MGETGGDGSTVIDSVFGDRQTGEANFVCCFKSRSECEGRRLEKFLRNVLLNPPDRRDQSSSSVVVYRRLWTDGVDKRELDGERTALS